MLLVSFDFRDRFGARRDFMGFPDNVVNLYDGRCCPLNNPGVSPTAEILRRRFPAMFCTLLGFCRCVVLVGNGFEAPGKQPAGTLHGTSELSSRRQHQTCQLGNCLQPPGALAE